MTLSTKAFFFIICALLISRPLTAMKRNSRTICSRTRGGKIVRTSERQNSTQYNHASDELWLPHDLWVSIALQDLSNLKTLRQTCSHVNKALKTITLDYLDGIITKNPKAATGIVHNFYICSQLLYRYGKELNEKKFYALWNSQSVNDKGIRNRFVQKLTDNITESVEPLHVFNVRHISIPNEIPLGFRDDEHYTPKKILNYLYEALHSRNPEKVHLASAFFFYDKKMLKEFLAEELSDKPILREACRNSNAECLKIVLDANITDPAIKLDYYKQSLLHFILSSNNEYPVEDKAQKIELIIQAYGKTRIDKNFSQQYDIVNYNHQSGTPLSYAISLFSYGKISLKELLKILTLLLRYGADPQVKVLEDSPWNKDYTVFTMIKEYTPPTARKWFITQEEADIIVDCLRSKQLNIITN